MVQKVAWQRKIYFFAFPSYLLNANMPFFKNVYATAHCIDFCFPFVSSLLLYFNKEVRYWGILRNTFTKDN